MGPRLVVVLIIILVLLAQGESDKSDEATLLKKLLADTEYDNRIKPTVGSNDQITATAAFSLQRVESLSEKTQVLTSMAVLSLMWTDSLLKWDPTTNGNTYRITVPSKYVWLPELAMLNSVSESSDVSLDSDFRVQIFFDGTVAWIPSFLLKTSCPVDLRYFPFDEQTCRIRFINWYYQASLLNFTVEDEMVDTQLYVPNGEWDLVSATQRSDSIELEAFPGAVLPLFELVLKFRRVPTFFLLNVVIPSVLITVLSVLVYWLPYESGEKVSLGITVLLSFSIVMLMISDVTPRNGNKMPLLSWYIIASMTLAGISLFVTVAILNIYHHCPAKPVPRWLRRIVLHGLARVLCMHYDDVTGNSVHPQNEVEIEELDEEMSFKKKGMQNVPNSLLPEEVIQYVQRLIQKEKETDRLDHNREEWVMVGKVLDRFFLISLVFVIALTSVVIFPLLEEG